MLVRYGSRTLPLKYPQEADWGGQMPPPSPPQEGEAGEVYTETVVIKDIATLLATAGDWMDLLVMHAPGVQIEEVVFTFTDLVAP